MFEWTWKKFDELTLNELYQIMVVRQEVFAVEQNCVYQDADGKDPIAWHLCAWKDQQLAAYLRVLPPGSRFKEVSFGRVLTSFQFRGQGLGKELTREVIGNVHKELPGEPIRISAQAYLEKFYGEFGFQKDSGTYLEDDIPHIEMVLKCSN